jgi:lysozyme|tara:strand:- start:1665 stop:2090 length:426 start_codon:yes stop_codon:yes gene_type:complete
MSKESLKERIKLHEGYRLEPYTDTLGYLTGGVGHRIMPNEEVPTTKEGWMKLFDSDFQSAWKFMERFCEENNLRVISDDAKEVLCEMIYQMGFSGVSKFKNMIKALQNRDYKLASIEMLDSRWAKQTPNRAKELSDHMAKA